MLAAPNALIITGGATTVILAFEVFPVPAFVELTCTLLFFTPAVVPCTFTETVQLAPGRQRCAAQATVEEPATAVAVPLHVVLRLFGVATTNPARQTVRKRNTVQREVRLVLLTVKVRLVVPFSGIVAAPNALAIVGGLITVIFADEVLPLPASVESIWTLLV